MNPMQVIKRVLLDNFEHFFVLGILASIAAIGYFVPYKLAFLNFFYIPVLMAGYFLGVRFAVLGAFFTALMIGIYAYLYPELFHVSQTPLNLMVQLSAWAGFLILSAVIVGRLNRHLQERTGEITLLDEQLAEHRQQLEHTTSELHKYEQELSEKVRERTQALEKSKQSIEEHKIRVEEALYSTMDASVVRLVIEKRLRTEKRRISILFSDLRGFTKYSEELRAELVVNDLNHYLADMEGVLLDFHAHIDKYMGDGIMAEFGAPIDYEQHALMAVCAGLRMQERLAAGNYPWQMRIGIATGEPIIGLIGGSKRQAYTALGDSVNLAARIEELCAPGAVTIDESTYDHVFPFFNLRRKMVVAIDSEHGTQMLNEVGQLLQKLEQSDADDPQLLVRIAELMAEANDLESAREYYQRAAELAPDNAQIKLAFADATLNAEHQGEVQIRGRKKHTHLFEVVGLKNPLLDTEKVPRHIHQRYHEEVEKRLTYPENLLLPIECLDGSLGHSRVVGFLSYAIAATLELPTKTCNDVLEAGYLADIGKSIIPHHLLNRRGSLNRHEFESVAAHSNEGVRKLRQMGYENEAMLEMVESHHENMNGTGYPRGLVGEQIPIGARIIAVADAYSALTSWRPYRTGWDARATVLELQKDAETGKYDAQVVGALVTLLGFEEAA